MKALVVKSFDQPPQYTEFPLPTPKENEIIIDVLAAGLHPLVKSIVSGQHYSVDDTLPFIPGVDGVGKLVDGTRVYFGAVNQTYGSMAEKTIANKQMCMPLPDELDSVTAAAIFNPGLSSWLALTYRAQLQANDTVLINGATGVAGRLAVQIAKYLGAGNIIVTGRNDQTLEGLNKIGADTLISLDQSKAEVKNAIIEASNKQAINIVIDYLWGAPAEIVLLAIAQTKPSKTRFVQVGDVAGKTITLPASVLRSSGIELCGTGIGATPVDAIVAAVPAFTEFAATQELAIKTQQISLKDAPLAWDKTPADGCRFVIVP